jgi:MoaA/NifB/PqqE/SkfB family radical SAM enzyme
MSLEMARSIIEQLADMGVRSITWTGGGEPTLHPEFDEIIRLAYYRGIDQGLYTHGGHINPERAALLKRTLSWVYVSLDAANRDDYQRDKTVDKFEAACDGIRNLVEAEGDATIGVGFLLGQRNWGKAWNMLHLARELGADYANFRPTVHYDMAHPVHIAESTNWMDEPLLYLQTLADEPDVQIDLPRFEMYQNWTEHGYSRCWWSHLQAVITPNGSVWTCVNKRESAADLLGDLTAETFADIWQRRPPVMVDDSCRVMCRGHIPNLTMAAAFEGESKHRNFI